MARVEYTTSYYDNADRALANVAYGTNGGTAVTAPSEGSSVPTRSDTVLVTSYAYTAAGFVDTITDPSWTSSNNRGVTKTYYDNAGRTTKVIEDFYGGTPTSSTNRTTEYTYDGLNHIHTLKATMPSGTNSQITENDYSVTTAGGSGINSYDFLATVKYPNQSTGAASTNASDQNAFTYNAQGEIATKTDQNGTVHTYGVDVLGRATSDSIALASGNPQNVDTGAQSIGVAFDTSGRPYQLTSYNNTTGGSGHEVNQIQRSYNNFGQLSTEYQEHSGAVNTSTSVKVQYAYTETSSGTVNNSRLTSVTYPSSRAVDYLYTESGGSSGLSDAISRVTAIANATTRGTNDANVIVSYDYLGLASPARKNYPTVGTSGQGLRLDRFGSSGNFANLDNFDRIIAQEWTRYTVSTGNNVSNSDVFNLNHGYDRDSNRLYANNTTFPSAGQVYSYDNLNRLTSDKGGTPNSTNTDVPVFQDRNDAWTLDALGNPTQLTPLVDTQQNTVNSQNQFTKRMVKANASSIQVIDNFSSSTHSAYWDGGGYTFDINSSHANALTITTDGGATILSRQYQGAPGMISTSATFPAGTTSGQIGIVCGDCKFVADLATQKYLLYQGGTLLASATDVYDINAGQAIPFSAYVTNGVFKGYQVGNVTLSPGFGGGRIGVYSTVGGSSFSTISVCDAAVASDIGGRWTSPNGTIAFSPGALSLGGVDGAYVPALLKNLKLKQFQADFQFSTTPGAQFVFDAQDCNNWKSVSMKNGLVSASKVVNGATSTVTGTATPTIASSSWARVTSDGTSITLKVASAQNLLTGASVCYTNNNFGITGGMLGFAQYNGYNSVKTLTVMSWDNSTSAFDKTETVEAFAIDSSGYTGDTANGDYSALPHYDNNENLTYDGVQAYTYDAWNRLMTVAHAYRDGSGASNVHPGQQFCKMAYDALGRRIMKSIGDSTQSLVSTGTDDCTYHSYLSGNSVIEERNGSAAPIRQFVWGLSYVDEAVQTAVNTNPSGTASWTNYWLCQDANFNVLGVVNSSGSLVERYEYSAYGQRQVFFSVGSNDPGCYAATFESRKVMSGGTPLTYGTCDIGHQGLQHDEQIGLVYNRARMLYSGLGRFMQEDPQGYVDGLALSNYLRANPVSLRDSDGLDANGDPTWGFPGPKPPKQKPAPVVKRPDLADCTTCHHETVPSPPKPGKHRILNPKSNGDPSWGLPGSPCTVYKPAWQIDGYTSCDACASDVVAHYGIPSPGPILLSHVGFGLGVAKGLGWISAGPAGTLAGILLIPAGWQIGTYDGAMVYCSTGVAQKTGTIQCDGTCK